MQRRNLKDVHKRALFSRLEHTRNILRAMLKDRSLPQHIRFHMSVELNSLPRNSTQTKIKNRCVQTGRSKGVYRLLKMSRIRMRITRNKKSKLVIQQIFHKKNNLIWIL
jgi:small subunit ribosomal protein S14